MFSFKYNEQSDAGLVKCLSIEKSKYINIIYKTSTPKITEMTEHFIELKN